MEENMNSTVEDHTLMDIFAKQRKTKVCKIVKSKYYYTDYDCIWLKDIQS